MKPKTLLVLSVLVALLGAFIWFFEREVPSTDERAERAKKVFPALAAAEVTGVVIERDGVKTVLEREAAKTLEPKAGEAGGGAPSAGPEPGLELGPAIESGEWRLVAPIAARADRAGVEALVATLAGLARERTVEGADRQAMGLVPPRARVTLRTAQGERVLEVGAEVPASPNVAVAVGDEVAIAPRAFWADLAKPPGDWRARELFPGRREAIERVTLTGPAGRVLLARRGEELWLESPLADRADRELTGALLTELTGLRAEKFLDGAGVGAPGAPGAESGLAPPAESVEVVLKDEKEPFRVEVGGPGSDPARRVARVGGQVVEISSRLVEALERPADGWRSRALSALETWGVDTVKVREVAGAFELRRDAGDWKRGGDRIAYGPVGDLLYAIAGLKAERLAATPAEAATSGEPRLTLDLVANDQRTETLTLYAERDGLVPARASGREAVLLLPRSAVDDLLAKVAGVRNEKPTPPPAAASATPAAGSKG